jgi:hypothetical protein
MVLREDKLRLYGGNSPSEFSTQKDTGYLGDDPFFKVNYKEVE